MAKITIKDLSDSVDLDREAMSNIYGGSRTLSTRPSLVHRRLLKTESLFLRPARKRRLSQS